VAGLIKVAERNDLKDLTCVCIITGMGLKDPDTAGKAFPFHELSVPPDLKVIEDALGIE
jgi:threonine synthase